MMLKAYDGHKPYIFISYSHKDQHEVFALISELQDRGYRIWYDEGIDPGTEWDENIASHIEKSGYFLALLSKNYLASTNCKDELNFARELELPRLLIYLEDVQLPSGMRMRLSRLQAIHKYTYGTTEAFFEKLQETNGLEDLRDPDVFLPEPAPAVPVLQQYPSEDVLNFLTAYESIPKDQQSFTCYTQALYRDQYTSEIAEGTMVVRDLIYPPQWVQPKDDHVFLPLCDIPVSISAEQWNAPPPHSSYLPYGRHGYARNRKTLLTGKTIFDAPIFGLESVSGSTANHDLALTVQKADYSDFLDTCEYLSYELSYVQNVLRKALPLTLTPQCDLPQRAQQKELRTLSNRFAAIGLNAATILHNVEVTDKQGHTGKSSFLLLNHAAHFDSIHPLPACSYQPTPFSDGRNMADALCRELSEELFSFDSGFDNLLSEPTAEILLLTPDFLGMGFHPVNTKVEVMTALQMDLDEPEIRKCFGDHHTADRLRMFFNSIFEGTVLMVPMDRTALQQYLQDPRTTPVVKEILAILLEHPESFRII